MTREVKPGGNGGPGDQDSSVNISVHFINVCPLKKPNFQPLWRASLSRWPPFEHSGTKMGSPDNEALYSTLCLSIISTCSTSKFHLKMSKCSAWGVVMPMANLYAKDCIALPSSPWAQKYWCSKMNASAPSCPTTCKCSASAKSKQKDTTYMLDFT